jgi:uncharacterized protein (DUF488 family)
MNNNVFTIGHSTHAGDYFIGLLAKHGISALADVRSSPFSRFNPQFNREVLSRELRRQNIRYVFVGEELGARSKDPHCYLDGKVQYDRIAQTELFKKGIARVLEGAERFRIALMCAEKDPLTCHRAILVSRALVEMSVDVEHILPDGSIEAHSQLVERMLRQWNLQGDDMFDSEQARLREAYRLQGDLIAYVEDSSAEREGHAVSQVREKPN